MARPTTTFAGASMDSGSRNRTAPPAAITAPSIVRPMPAIAARSATLLRTEDTVAYRPTPPASAATPAAPTPMPTMAHWQDWSVQFRLPQLAQATPFFPHLLFAVPGRQVVALAQHPVAQPAALQTQIPPTHDRPVAHGTPATPHWQRPDDMQPSAVTGSQAAHAAPGAPQVARARAVQAPAEQHPVGQEAASQTQAPAEQRWPAAHGAAPPHSHAPAAEHTSPTPAQLAQGPPTGPHAVSDGVVQTRPLQQPSGQLVASQTQAAPKQR